jgi:hypothetical protein
MVSEIAPMIGMKRKKIGNKRFSRLMQTVGPIMASMAQQGGGHGGISGLGGIKSATLAASADLAITASAAENIGGDPLLKRSRSGSAAAERLARAGHQPGASGGDQFRPAKGHEPKLGCLSDPGLFGASRNQE